jgi:ribosome-binding protein aMBF1 (putative translation factor)
MKKKQPSPFEKDTWKRVEEDRQFAEAFFEELIERPLPVQVSILRRMRGISQIQLASQLHVKQSFLSKLEKEGSDHLVSIYEKLARLLKGRLAIIPSGARIVATRAHPKLHRKAA